MIRKSGVQLDAAYLHPKFILHHSLAKESKDSLRWVCTAIFRLFHWVTWCLLSINFDLETLKCLFCFNYELSSRSVNCIYKKLIWLVIVNIFGVKVKKNFFLIMQCWPILVKNPNQNIENLYGWKRFLKITIKHRIIEWSSVINVKEWWYPNG